MDLDSIIEGKVGEARTILSECVGKDGMWASGTSDGYKDVYFTRDLAIALEGLVLAGVKGPIKDHLDNLSRRQGENGSINVFFVGDYRAWARQKLKRAILEGEAAYMIMKKINLLLPKMSKRIGSMGATHQTTDSELQYINAIGRYAELTGDHSFLERYQSSMERALQFSNSRIKNGLYTGVDWRDNVRFESYAALLSNNALLFSAYRSIGLEEQAGSLRTRIREQFWNGEFYSDQPGSSNFDSFGQALAVLNGIATEDQYGPIERKFQELKTDISIRVNDLVRPIKMRREEKVSVNRVDQYSTVWPFVTGYVILALDKMGMQKEAKELFLQWAKLD